MTGIEKSGDDLLAAIAAVTGGDGVLTGAAATAHYRDWRGRYQGDALAVVFPSDTQLVRAVVKLCAANQV